MPPTPGLIFVLSKPLPTSEGSSSLTAEDFCTWYEETHIQEVQATGGISSTQRYERVNLNQKCRYDFLTVYHMPDLQFRHAAVFKGLAGQSRPSDELVAKIFERAEFCTRFCEEVEDDDVESAGNVLTGEVPYVITVAAGHSTSTYSPSLKDYLTILAGLEGYRGMTKYSIQEASVLSAFKRTQVNEPEELAILKFDRVPPISMPDVETEGLELGVWSLKRNYDGGDRTPATWIPPQ